MEIELFKKVLRRFKREELEDSVKKWGRFGRQPKHLVDFADSKQMVISNLTRVFETKDIDAESVGLLDLLYITNHPKCKKWTVFKLSKTEKNDAHDLVDVQKFERRLRKTLNVYHKMDLNVLKHEEAIWIRIYIYDGVGKTLVPGNVVFLVHYPHTPCLLTTKIKEAHREYILQSVMNVLGCHDCDELMLSGYCVTSLAQMVLNKDCQGSFSKYRFNEVDNHPLARRKKRKREDSDTFEEEDFDVRIVYENIEEKRHKLQMLEDSFGSHMQPTLEKVEYKLETSFRGCKVEPGMSSRKEPFHCKVKFEGPSVLEGIRNLGKRGIASIPIPYHLSRVHSLGKNYFVLGDKKKTQTSTNESIINEHNASH